MVLDVYSNFFEDIRTDPAYEKYKQYVNDDFIISYISSPFKSNNPNHVTEYSIYIYFSSLNRHILLKKEYAFESLSRIYIGHVPLKDYVENISHKRWKEFSGDNDAPRKFSFDTSTFKRFITTKDLKNYGFKLWTFTAEEARDILNETIAVYEFEDNVYLIPSIVSFQAFYIKSKYNSLYDAMRSPQGIGSMVNVFEFRILPDTGKKKYYLDITGDAHMEDCTMLAYFSSEDYLKRIFNDISMNISHGNKIEAIIPKKGIIEFVGDSFYREHDGKKVFLVTSVYKSNLTREFVDQVGIIDLAHPNSCKYSEVDKGTKKNSNRISKDTKGNNKLNDNNKVDYLEKALEVFSDDMHLDSSGSTELAYDKVSAGNRDRSKKGQATKSDKKEKSPSTRKPRGGEGEAKPIENKATEEKLNPLGEENKTKEEEVLIKELKLKGLKIISMSYLVPFPNGLDKGPAFCYTDSEKQHRRSFFVMRVSGIYCNKDICFFYVSLKKDKNGKRKEVLVIKRKNDFSNLVDNEIKSAILDQVENGDRKWLKDNSTILEEKEYITLRHRTENGDFKSYVDRTIDRVIHMQ